MKKFEDARIMKVDEAMKLLTRITRGNEQETVVFDIDLTDRVKKEADSSLVKLDPEPAVESNCAITV